MLDALGHEASRPRTAPMRCPDEKNSFDTAFLDLRLSDESGWN